MVHAQLSLNFLTYEVLQRYLSKKNHYVFFCATALSFISFNLLYLREVDVVVKWLNTKARWPVVATLK
jgi:hypothetical protein